MSSAVLGLALVAAGCGAPPVVVPSASPTRHLLRVVAAGADGPLAGLRVCAVPLRGAPTCAPTGSDGTASLRVAPGAYQVRSDLPEGQRRIGELVGVDLTAADASARLLFERTRRIAGTVRDIAGVPVAAAAVCAEPLSLAATVCEKSRGDGSYVLEVTPGLYKVRFDGAPGRRLLAQWAVGRVTSGEADVADARAADVGGLDVALRPGVVLAGTITALDGHPVKRAQVCTHRFSASLPWECERTDEHGRYVALREPDRYWVWVIPPDDEALLMQWYDDAPTGVGATPVDLGQDATVDQVLGPGPSISGRVVDPAGNAVYHAFVCVDTPFPTGRICRPTDETGAYRVTTRPETYTVQVLPPDGSGLLAQYYGGGRTWLDAHTVTVRAQPVTVDVRLVRGLTVSGVIRSAVGGVPLEGASINISDAQGVVGATWSDEAGAYSLAVPAGRYSIDVFAPFASHLQSVVGQGLDVDRAVVLDVALPDGEPGARP